MRNGRGFQELGALALVALLGAPLQGPVEEVESEHFVIELEPGGALPEGAGPQPVDPVGLAVWRRRALPDGEQVEWQVRFHESGFEDTRVLHLERERDGRTKTVWREWRARGGRTLLGVETDDGAGLRILEWGREESLRETLPVGGEHVLPLSLQERVRGGEVSEGRFRVFDPLARGYESVAVRTRVDDQGRRAVELRRDDGTLAAAWHFAGTELRSFQWQAGTLRGRRITADEYQKRLRAVLAGSD